MRMSDLQDILSRLLELESQAAFQDDQSTQLNDVIARQDREIRNLKEQVDKLSRRLQEIGDSMPGESPGQGEDPPPHY
jgi:uncharacterized coiled-coil protein SlyX